MLLIVLRAARSSHLRSVAFHGKDLLAIGYGIFLKYLFFSLLLSNDECAYNQTVAAIFGIII